MLAKVGAIVTVTLFLHVPGPGWVASQACTYPCECPSQPLQCPAGTSLLLDGCGCCKVCARQLGELCSLQKPCDRHKGLYCDFSKVHRDSGICLAHEGATCDLLGSVYLNGESFQPSCKLQCVCMDGAIGCIPLCSDGARLPSPDCPFPRRVKAQNKCCEEWICKGGRRQQSLSRKEAAVSAYRKSPPPTPMSRHNSLQENCLVQTTGWSACSKTCGMGISTRVTNDNPQCRLEKESRLCLVRDCEGPLEETIKKGKKCIRSPKSRRAIQFEFTGCTSVQSYRPKFCGSCTDGRCCTPHVTSTVEVAFRCPEGGSFVRKMMVIKSCSCHYDCPAENDIFLAVYHRRMIGDHVKLERQ
ncbi:CCN family member 2-like [Varanus komodoensis]|uniref:CCN family member 2-like n=1 Tax=Varanus komodoensis TaxID=61221 RepID=UPI001CF7C9FF|nr:CCN family member 2-like [Varanus komodoensis]